MPQLPYSGQTSFGSKSSLQIGAIDNLAYSLALHPKIGRLIYIEAHALLGLAVDFERRDDIGLTGGVVAVIGPKLMQASSVTEAYSGQPGRASASLCVRWPGRVKTLSCCYLRSLCDCQAFAGSHRAALLIGCFIEFIQHRSWAASFERGQSEWSDGQPD